MELFCQSRNLRRTLVAVILTVAITLIPLNQTIQSVHASSTERPATGAYEDSLTADFAARDALPQTKVRKSHWNGYGKWGPPAARYPAPAIPSRYDRVQWQRDRIIAVAKKYIGVPYRHKHIPALGLDCSNYTAWVYNYGLGIKFTSNVRKQAATVGRKLSKNEPLKPGDLLYFGTKSGRITHTAIYIKPGYMIDEAHKVKVKRFPYGWNKRAFKFARRVIR